MTGLSNYAFIEFYTTDDAVNWMEANKVESVTLKKYMYIIIHVYCTCFVVVYLFISHTIFIIVIIVCFFVSVTFVCIYINMCIVYLYVVQTLFIVYKSLLKTIVCLITDNLSIVCVCGILVS